MKFDWDKFKDAVNKIVVHCKAEEEANDFCRQMDEHGMRWCTKDSYLEENKFYQHKEKTCYFGADGTFGKYEYFADNNYTILEWSDYMKKEFTRADLKDGMFVVYRNGEIRIVVGNFIIGSCRHSNLCNYDKNLFADSLSVSPSMSMLDIVKVGKLVHEVSLNLVEEKDLYIIWERKEPQKLTADDAAKKLKELTGKDYEIV